MKSILFLVAICTVSLKNNEASICGCKSIRPCYHDMVNELKARDEESCIEDAAIGASTVFIFLKAIKQYCPELINVNSEALTFESRYLYEVLLTKAPEKGKEEEYQNRPVIVVDAGMEAGTESVGLALFLIEQLAACGEYNEMLEKIRWIILPAVNPDGMEYSRFNHLGWRKNVRPSEDQLSFGVDVSRNFDSQWSACDRVDSGFSPVYPGSAAATENETMFVKNILGKYKKDAKAYLSIRRDGHAILYPYAYAKNSPPNSAQLSRVAGGIANKVNQRAGGVQLFINDSIFHINGKERCGHSVDYALDLGISYSYEMRVFVGSDNRIIERFQAMPRGYDNSLRAGYFTGIRELFNAIVNEKKYRYF